MSFRQLIAEQNRHLDTTDAQREANEYRLMLYDLLIRSRAPYEARVLLDVHNERIIDPSYRITPNIILMT